MLKAVDFHLRFVVSPRLLETRSRVSEAICFRGRHASTEESEQLFFSFDGIDGSGKSTQMALFVEWLREAGHSVVTCRDPGTTKLGEAVRAILLGADYPIDFRAEMLLYMAARAQLVEEVIRPALEQGHLVVSDRFLIATVAYQGAGGIPATDVWQVGKVATDRTLPDLTFLLDVDPETASQRMTRERDRMEARGLEYFGKVRAGFLEEASRHPQTVHVVDATADVDAIQADIRTVASGRLTPP